MSDLEDIIEYVGGDLQSILSNKEYDRFLDDTEEWATKFGLGPADGSVKAFVNGIFSQGSSEAIIGTIFREYDALLELYNADLIDDTSNVYDVLLSQPDVFKTYSPFVAPTQTNPLSHISFLSKPQQNPTLPSLDNILKRLKFVSSLEGNINISS
jgi:hypothetical protein